MVHFSKPTLQQTKRAGIRGAMSRKSKLLYTAFIVAVLAAVIIIGEHNGDFGASLRAMTGIPKRYTLLCVLCVVGGIAMQAASTASLLGTMGHALPFPRLLVTALLGEFYAFITPGASGGQPMQIVQLRRWGAPVADATTALVTHYVCYHGVLLVMDVALGLMYRPFVAANLGANFPFLAIGFLFNLGLLVGALMLSFCQKPIRWLLTRVTRLMVRLRLGDPDRLSERFSNTADAFYTGIRFIIRHRSELFRQVLFAVGRLLCMTSVFYFICRGLGQPGEGYGSLIALGAMQYTSAGYTPLPGASGAQEGIFSLYFGKLLPGDLLLSGLLAWRFITYYLVLVVGGVAAVWPKRRR